MARSPTVETLVLMGLVYAAQLVAATTALVLTPRLVVAPPIVEPAWTPVTSVYAHGSIAHLTGNALALALLGFIVERGTSRLRFHLYFVATGSISVLAEAAYQQALGTPAAVLGASGAVFALLGYLLAGNPVSGRVLGWLDLPAWSQLLLVGVVAGGIALWATPEGAALIGHFTGLALGLVAGRLRVLRTT